MKQERIPVAPEGYPFIGYSVFLTLVSAALGLPLLTLALVLITTFILLFFRDPERAVPVIDRGLISPADGKIIFIGPATDPRFSAQETVKISIFMNVFNVHVNRIPCAGTVLAVDHVAGSFLAADSDKAHLLNEYCAVRIGIGPDREITMVQIAGLIARRIVCRLEAGDQVSSGDRFGLIRFGSRVDLYLPRHTNIAIRLGEKVRAGESLLAYLG